MLATLANEHPEDMHLRATARQYVQTKLSLGATADMRNTAIYHAGLSAFKRMTGAEWSGNP